MSIFRSTDDYARSLLALLPTGPVWPRGGDSVLARLMAGFGAGLARVHGAALDLEGESDPRAAGDLLEEWEAAAGLPDDCTETLADTLQERRDSVVSRLTDVADLSRQAIIDLATVLGYAITIEEFVPFTCGLSQCGDPLNGAATVRFNWKVEVPDPRVTFFRTGESRIGDSLGQIDRADDLECALKRLAPAHTTLIFSYTGV